MLGGLERWRNRRPGRESRRHSCPLVTLLPPDKGGVKNGGARLFQVFICWQPFGCIVLSVVVWWLHVYGGVLMPTVSLRLTEGELAKLREWARSGRRSLQKEIVWRLFSAEAVGAAKVGPTAGVVRVPVRVAADGSVHEMGAEPVGPGAAVGGEERVGAPESAPAHPSRNAGTISDLKFCPRGNRHHIFHSGKPCPDCGYPKVREGWA